MCGRASRCRLPAACCPPLQPPAWLSLPVTEHLAPLPHPPACPTFTSRCFFFRSAASAPRSLPHTSKEVQSCSCAVAGISACCLQLHDPCKEWARLHGSHAHAAGHLGTSTPGPFSQTLTARSPGTSRPLYGSSSSSTSSPHLRLVHQQHRILPGRRVCGHGGRPHWRGHHNRLGLALLLLLGLLACLLACLLLSRLLLVWAVAILGLLSSGGICSSGAWAQPLPLDLLPWLVCHGAVQPNCRGPARAGQQPAPCTG